MDFRETFARLQRLLKGLAVCALVVALLLPYLLLPGPFVLIAYAAILIAIVFSILISIPLQRWIDSRRTTPVYRPPVQTREPETPSYQRGYQSQTPVRPTPQFFSTFAYPQPKDESPGAIYEQPLVQYPEQF